VGDVHVGRCHLYIHTQAVDTTTPAGRAMFGMLGIFAEFEREMIHARVVAGIERVRGEIQRNGRFTSKAGKVRKRLGRPNADPKKVELARQALANGTGVLKTAKLVGLGRERFSASSERQLQHEKGSGSEPGANRRPTRRASASAVTHRSDTEPTPLCQCSDHRHLRRSS
jgi:DNA invertase Pin-like site-specific DNA recombinase